MAAQPDVGDLFGDESDEELEQPKSAAAAADVPASAKPGDVRSKLAELANRKRKEQEEAAATERKQKKQKKEKLAIDFGDSDEEGNGDYEAGVDEEEQGRGEAVELVPEEDEEEKERAMLATDADRDFIDDTELAPGERIDFGDDDQEAVIANAEEASEDDDELERLFNKKRGGRGRERSELENKAAVENFLAQMEVAVEEDQKDYMAGRPAVHKLRMLQRVEEMLSTKRLHNELLDGGLLGVLKAWLEPLPDGTLPNSKVRGTVLRLLGQLPVDCAQEDRKEQLKRSGLGRVVMFLFKVPDETPANRRIAKELIERWSRPILAPRAGGMDAEEQQRILEARQARQQRLAAQQRQQAAGAQAADADDPDAAKEVVMPGQPGFRWHAMVPQAASLDYVRLPTSQYAMPEKKQGGSKKDQGHKLNKKLENLRKKGKSTGRAALASVEGRNVTLQG